MIVIEISKSPSQKILPNITCLQKCVFNAWEQILQGVVQSALASIP